MTVVATLLVRDERDIVADNIRFHLDQGVSHLVVMDNGSLDGTVDVVEEFVRMGVAELHHQPDQDYRQGEWVTFMARRAAVEHGATWVINLDADEFWVPKDRSRTLAEVFAEVPDGIGTVRALRDDYLYRRGNESGPWHERCVWRNRKTVSSRGKPLTPKVAHRAHPDVVVGQGNHRAEAEGLGKRWKVEPLEILHVPRRSWEQYRTKIDNGGSAYANNPDLPETMGAHWRRDYAKLLAGELEDEYRAQLPGAGALARGVLSGALRHDTWLRDRVRALRSA